MRTKGKSAWILEWDTYRDDLGVSNLKPIILPRRWSKERVKDVMRVVFWNSPLWATFETQANIDKPLSKDLLVIDSGSRIDLSNHGGTVLTAAYVKDLRISRHPDGGELMEWTLPPHISLDKESGEVRKVSKCIPRSYRDAGLE